MLIYVSLIQLDAAIREAFDVAYQNIYAFHVAQKSAERSVENMKVSNITLNHSYIVEYFVYKRTSVFPVRVLDANVWQGALLL